MRLVKRTFGNGLVKWVVQRKRQRFEHLGPPTEDAGWVDHREFYDEAEARALIDKWKAEQFTDEVIA